MEDEEINFDRGETIESNYCCSECPSLIEILSINENNNIIEFRCTNKRNPHYKVMNLGEYLEKRISNNFPLDNINNDTCIEHKKKYLCFCSECNKHLCKKCQKNGNHIPHQKINNIEIEPLNEELEIMKKIIDYYEEKIDKFYRNMNNTEDISINIFLDEKDIKIQKIEQKKEEEMKKNKDKYLEEIKLIKEKYENEMKKIKREYLHNNNRISNKYKLEKEKIDYIYTKKYQDRKNNKYLASLVENEKKKNKIYDNFKMLNELVYNTYNIYKENVFNAINISNIIINYYEKNEYIKYRIIKHILKDENNEKIDFIYRKINCFKNENRLSFIDKTNKNENAAEIRRGKPQIKINIINNNLLNIPQSEGFHNKKEKIVPVLTDPNNYDGNIINPPNNKQHLIRPHEIKGFPFNKGQFLQNKEEYNENLFILFNSIFFKNIQQTSINS